MKNRHTPNAEIVDMGTIDISEANGIHIGGRVWNLSFDTSDKKVSGINGNKWARCITVLWK